MPKLVKPGEKSSTSPGRVNATAVSMAGIKLSNTPRTGSGLPSFRASSCTACRNASVPVPRNKITSRQRRTMVSGQSSRGRYFVLPPATSTTGASNACKPVRPATGVVLALSLMLRNFRGIPHPLEEVRVLNEVRYINDSASTTPVAGRTGLQAFDAPVVLVAGGNTKYLPLEDWPETIVRRCRDVILLRGTGTDALRQAVQEEARKLGKPDPVRGVFDNLTPAMDTAVALTRPVDGLLVA